MFKEQSVIFIHHYRRIGLKKPIIDAELLLYRFCSLTDLEPQTALFPISQPY